MIFGDGVAVSVVRGAYSELDVGLCELDVFFDIGTAQLKKVLGRLKTGLPRRHRIQSVEGPVLDPRAKETCLKRGQKVDPLFFRPTPDGSRQVVNQAGKTIALCKFTELMQ